MLDLRRLRYFIHIVDSGSMSAASRKLHVAQPALSHHMAELERLVGLPLLERLAHGIRLTEYGAVLYEHAEQIVNNVEDAEKAMRQLREREDAGGPRIVRLALIPSWATSFTPVIVREVQRRMPDFALNILEARNEEAVRMIEAGDVDLALTLVPGGDPSQELILQEPLYVLSATKGPDQISLSDLSKTKLLLPSRGNTLRKAIDEAARRAGILLQINMEIEGQDTVKRAVEAGIGISILSWNSVRQECAKGTLFASRIVSPEIHRPVYLRKGPAISDTLFGLFRDIMREITAPMPDNGSP